MLKKTESITAKICAYARAYHSYFEKDKIYDDYLAFDILGYDEYEHVRNLLKQTLAKDIDQNDNASYKRLLNENIFPIPISRIKYAEEKLINFSKENVNCQYVICGAGFDTFAFRNTNSNIKIFELDHPNTQKYKKDRIKDMQNVIPKNVNFVSINFNSESIEEKLIEAGFCKDKKTFFAILGVSYYLDIDTLSKTFESISRLSSNGSELIFDYPDQDNWNIERVKRLKEYTAFLGEKMGEGFKTDKLKEILNKNNYKIIDYKDPHDIQREYFNGRHDNLRAFENVHFALAEKF